MKCTGNWLDRRGFLSVGVAGGLGITLADMLRMEQARADLKNYESKEGVAKSVISIFLPGGMAHQETFDPKPFAPVEYRGPLGSIETVVPGVRVGEVLPHTAKVVDKLAICRSMTHGEAAHERGTHNMFTGYRPSPALQYPSIGSVVAHEFGPRNNLPPYVCIPNLPAPDAGAGYLGSEFGPFAIGSDPGNADFSVRDLSLPGGVDADRFSTRRRLRDAVGRHFQRLEGSENLAALDSFYERAYSLVSSAEARGAFDIKAESDATRDEYGRNTAGQRMLLARRLVEAGVRFVTLSYGGWDMHANITDNIQKTLPPFDQAYASLIRDLEARGLLDSTLVMVS
ncbi:MAG: DUF1501 domain-containing protein, partial [Planctomycetota bacterium]